MRRLLATVGALGLAVGVLAGEPAPEPAVLVAKLGSDDFREREAAVAALGRAGPAAIPALRQAMKASDPEVRHRAGPILQKLHRAADSADRLAPKTFALNYKAVPLGSALNDFKTRTGLNVVLDADRIADPLRTVTVVTGELPLWEALDAFCAAAGLREAFATELELPKAQLAGRYALPPTPPTADAAPLTLIDGKGRVPGARSSAVRVLVLPAAFPGHRVTLGTGETTLCLDVAPAPGLNWQEVAAVKITKLIDDAGRVGSGAAAKSDDEPLDLEGVVVWGGPGVKQGFARFDRPFGAQPHANTVPNPRVVAVPLKIATPHAKRLKRLEGLVLGEIALPNQALITVTDPAKHVGKSFDGPGRVSFAVTSITEGKDFTTVRFTVRYPSPWSVSARRGQNPGGLWPEAPRGANQTPIADVFDAAGKPIMVSTTNHQSTAGEDGQTLLDHRTWTFHKGRAPAKVVVTGSRPVIVEVPFALDDVPLP